MKKTKRFIGVTALLLAALMLFSSCAITYRDVDSSEYVKLADGFDFKNFKLSTETEKMIVTDDDVKVHINKELFALREAVKNSNGDPDVNQVGEYNKYDVLTIRTILYDKSGNLVKDGFVLGSKADPANDGTIVLGSEQALYLGYGVGINQGLLEKLENDMFLAPETALLAENQHVIYNNVGSVKAGALGMMPAVGYVTYSTTYTSGTNNTHDGNKVTTVSPMHFDKIAADIAADGVGTNSYDEVIYLGLKALIEQQKDIEGKQIMPSLTKELNIAVYPTATAIPDEAVKDENNVAIQYDIDFADTTKLDYKKGTVKVKLQGTVDFTDSATAPSAFVTTYTYPDDATGTYTVGSEKKDLKGTECTVYTYVVERAPYTRPDYNAATVKEKLGFTTESTDDATVVAEYEASIKSRLQKACDALAEEEVKQVLLAQILANTTLLEDPVRNIKNYVNGVIDQAKEQYHAGGYRDKVNASGEYVYDDFEDFLITTYYTHKKDADNKTIYFGSRKEVENDLYAEGRELVKESILIYYLADQIGCRLSDDQLLAMAKERGTAWAKEQIEAGREYLLASNTVENLKASYPDSYASSTDTKTKKQQLFETWGADSYEDCLAKQLAYYGEMYGENFASWDEFARAAYPDDAYDWEDYVESKQGRENLYGIYHAEVVMAKLLELNAANVAASYKEIAFDATKVELK